MLIITVTLLTGCKQEPVKDKTAPEKEKIELKNLTPEKVVEKWFESIVKGDWDVFWKLTVDIDGKPYSKQDKEAIKSQFNSWTGADYTLKILGVSDKYMKITEMECKSVEVSVNMKSPTIGNLSFSSSWQVAKHERQWKVQIISPTRLKELQFKM